MRAKSSIALDDTEYDMAATILRMVKPSLDDDTIGAAYSAANEHVSKIERRTSARAIFVWRCLTFHSIDDLILFALGKELTQIVSDIDADDSVIDFFGWLLVGKMHHVNVEKILDTLHHRVYHSKDAW